MKRFHPFRPHFHFHSPMGLEEAVQHLADLVQGEHPDYVGRIAVGQRHAELRIPIPERHLWSPTLSVDLQASARADGCEVSGLLAPHPSVWTAVAFSNLALVTGFLFLTTLGLVQRHLEETAWGLIGAGIMLLLLLLVFAVAQVGQRLGAPQARHLRSLLEIALAAPAAEAARTAQDPYHP